MFHDSTAVLMRPGISQNQSAVSGCLGKKLKFFVEKWKYQNADKQLYSYDCEDQHIQKWA